MHREIHFSSETEMCACILAFCSLFAVVCSVFCENVYQCLMLCFTVCIITNGGFGATQYPLTFVELQGSSCHAPGRHCRICSSTFEGLLPFFVADIQEASLPVNPVS